MTGQPKNTFLRSRIALCFALLLTVLSYDSYAQKEGYFQIFGSIKNNAINLEGAEVKVMSKNVVVQTLTTTENGQFSFNIPFDGEFLMSVSKPGLLGKSIMLLTKVPENEKDMIFTYKLNIDLLAAEGDSGKAAVIKPIASIAYSTTYQDFDFKTLK